MRHERLWRAAQRIAPLDWRLGDPLLLLRDLSHERFDLVLAEPPFGMRVPVASAPMIPADALTSRISCCGAWRRWWLTTVPCSSMRPMTSFGRSRGAASGH